MPAQLDTLKKAGIKYLLDFKDRLRVTKGLFISNQDLAAVVGVHRNTITNFDREGSLRTRPEGHIETRGRKRKVGPEECQKIVQLYDDYPDEAPDLAWSSQLANACNVEACNRTISKAMRKYEGIQKYVACPRHYVGPRNAEERVDHCKTTLEKYDQVDFLRFRYSDENHCSWKQKPMGRQYISRKRGERYEPKNTRPSPAPEEPRDEVLHVWGCIGLGFKSDLVMYRVPAYNGKLDQRTYLNTMLIPHVGKWLDDGQDFVLEEDNDSGHGPGASNRVRTWKKNVGLEYFFNSSHSPDLSPIENCWVPVNNVVAVNARMLAKAEDLFELAQEAWYSEDHLPQETIDELIRSARYRYKDCIESGGQWVKRERLARPGSLKRRKQEEDLERFEEDLFAGDSEDAEGEEYPDQDQFER